MAEDKQNSHGILSYKPKTHNAISMFVCKVADVNFSVAGETFYAHREFLSTESKYFQTMFNEGFKEANNLQIPLPDTPAVAFKIMLNCLYSGQADLTNEEFGNVLDLMELSHRYGFTEIEDGTVDFIKAEISTENVLSILSMTVLLNQQLATMCCDFFSENIDEITAAQDLNELTVDLLVFLLKHIRQPMQTKFQIASKWLDNHNDCTVEEKEKLLSIIDLSEMSNRELLKIVEPTKLITAETLLKVLASREMIVLLGTSPEYALFSSKGFYMESVPLVDNEQSLQVVRLDLDGHFTFNKVEVTFLGAIKCGYQLEASEDSETWTKLVDYRKFRCYGKQELYFPTIEAKYLQISATKVFKCNSLTYSQCDKPPKLVDGFICPTVSVCDDKRAAIPAVSGTNKLAIFDEKNTIPLRCDVGSSITIYFNQPYWLNWYEVYLTDDDWEQCYEVDGFGGARTHFWGETVNGQLNGKCFQDTDPIPTTSVRFRAKGSTAGTHISFKHVKALFNSEI